MTTVAGSTTVQPLSIASSRSPGATHIAARPKVGSTVASPGSAIGLPCGSMTRSMVGRMSPRPTSTSLIRIT